VVVVKTTPYLSGTRDAREVMKTSMGRMMTDKLVRGVDPDDVYDWFEYVVVVLARMIQWGH
jgi:hypothetical protein